MMEKWNIGDQKRIKILFYIFDLSQPYKNRSHTIKPNIPTFHYSNTPWHSLTTLPSFSELA